MKKSYSFIVLLTCAVMSCSKIPQIKIDFDRETFEKEYAAWSAQNIKNYQFIYEYCSMAMRFNGPVKITIEEGNEPIIEHSFDYIENIPYTSIADMYERINGMFDYMEGIKNGNSPYKVKSATLQIEYNTQFHFPKKVFNSVIFTDKDGTAIPGSGSITIEITDFLSN